MPGFIPPFYRDPRRNRVTPFQAAAATTAAGLGLASLAGKYTWNKFGKAAMQRANVVNSRRPALPSALLKQRRRRKKTVQKQLSEIRKSVKASNGLLVYRNRDTIRCLSSVNSMTQVATSAITMTALETVLAQLRFFDPNNPTVLITASGASANYMRTYLFKKIFSKVIIRNNYQVPCKISCYVVRPKEDTSIAPLTTFTNGLADIGNPSSSSPLVFLTDSDEFNDLYKIEKSDKKYLNPGESYSTSFSLENIQYDPAVFDSHGLAYQRKYGSYVILVRCEGVIAHDSSADQQGTIAAGVDIMWDDTYEVEYDAGIDLKFIVIQNSADSFTNGALVSSMPVADNIAYSVS